MINVLFLASAVVSTNCVTKLDPVTVYASKCETAVEKVAARASVYTYDEISSSGTWSFDKFLSNVENIPVRSVNSNPLQCQIAMRGYGENSFGRVKILFDGECLNNVDMSSPDISRIFLSNLERVEVIHGPSPVLHGDGAVAGVISVTSADLPVDGFGGSVSSHVASHDTYSFNFRGRCSDLESGYFASGTYGYSMSGGYRDRSAYDIHTSNVKFGRIFTEETYVKFSGSHSAAFYEMPGALTYEQWKGNPRQSAYVNDWCRQWNYASRFEMRATLAENKYIVLDGSFTHRYRRVNWGDYGYVNSYETFVFNASPRYLDKNIFFGYDNVFTGGFDFNGDIYSVRDRSNFSPPKSRFNREKCAVFLHEQFYATDDFSLTGGVRGETICNRWKGVENGGSYDNAYETDFEIGALYNPSRRDKYFLKFARFHRSPFCDEMTYTRDAVQLKPESGYSIDAGCDIQLCDFISVYAVMFASRTEDEIFYNPYIEPTQWGWNGYNCNSPSPVRRVGLDVGIDWRINDNIKTALKYSGVDARFDGGQYDNKNVPLVPAHRIRAEIEKEILSGLSARGGVQFFSSERLMGDFLNIHSELKGACVFDASLSYSPSWVEGLTADLAIENIFDKDYCDYAGWSDYTGAYFYPASGRVLRLSVRYDF